MREEFIYTLLRLEKSLYENKYLQNNTSDVIKEKISDIRTELAKYGDIITDKERDAIRNELFEIENKTQLTRKEKNNIIKRLNDISLYIDNKRKYEKIERDYNYYGISGLEHMHGNIDDYYTPVLPRQSFDGNYEFYTSRGDKNKELFPRQYFHELIPHLHNLIDEKKSANQKIQLDLGVNLKYSTDTVKRRTFYVKSRNVDALPGDDTNDIINELTNSLFDNYQQQILIPRNGSGYVFDGVEVLGIPFHTIEVKRGSSYIKAPDWLKRKGATINPKNTKDNYCFMYAITVALNHEEIGRDPERIPKLIPHIPKYNWDGIDFPVGRKNWKTFEKNNRDIALNKEKIEIQYKSKYNRERKKQVALLMITNNKSNWHYLALKSIPTDNGYIRPTKAYHGYSEANHLNIMVIFIA